MHSIVSLLDSTSSQLVEDLWAELKQEFGVQGVYATPYPHFSYQVAKHYDLEALQPILRNFAWERVSFTVRTAGLGIFTGFHPVLYIPVVRNSELTDFHQSLQEKISPVGAGIQDYYSPKQWIPHITIGFGDISNESLTRIVRHLSGRDFNWEVNVDNIALIYDTGTRQELRERFKLSGKSYIEKRWHPVTHESIERLRRTREAIMKDRNGKLFEDSAEMIRQMREERAQHLDDVISGKYTDSGSDT